MQLKQTALLSRLSREDEQQGESESIQNQKIMLEQYSRKKKFTNLIHYVDDGYSGTNFDRPDFQRLIKDIENGKIGIVITKDLSRLGRDYLKIGMLLEDFFPKYNVRYIAINDDIDTDNGIPEYTPFKNIMNEWYAKDISKKVRSSYRAKALAGHFTGGTAPYGYMKDPKNKHHLIIDEETAPVVRKIFNLAVEGKSAYQIASQLKSEQILKPIAKTNRDTGKYYRDLWDTYPYDWSKETISNMVKRQEYLGHLVCNKHSTVSYKSKKLLKLPEDKWIITKNTHEPIISEELFERANKVFNSMRKRKKKTGERNMFSGLLRCATCGKTLTMYAPGTRVDAFCCGTYRQFGKSYCSAHYLRCDAIYDFVLNDIKEHIKKVLTDKDKFIQDIIKQTSQSEDKTKSQKSKELKKIEHRLNELQLITKRLYEDLAIGRITEDTYDRALADYTLEETKLREKSNNLYQSIQDLKSKEKGVSQFIQAISKYENLAELNAKIVNELINKIVVYEREIIDSVRTQKIEIEYNFLH